MVVYLLATIGSCILYFILNIFFKKKTILKVFIALLPMLIVSAIRYDVGWDYLDIYTNGFFLIGKGYMPHYFSEVPFDKMVNLIYIISNQNPDWLFIICSIITFFFISKAIKDQSVNVIFSIALIFFIRYYFLTLNIVRQGIAMSIILCSYKYIKEKNFKKYIITILLASCFHMMSLIYIPIYFLYKVDWKKKRNLVIMVLLPILFIGLYLIVMKYTKYGNYLGSKFHNNEFLVHEIILSGTVLVLATLQIRKVSIEREYFYVYYILQIITFIVAILSKILPVADRLVWMVYAQNIFFIPLIVRNIKEINQKALITMCLIIIMSISVYAQAGITDSYSIIPYQTIFEK